MVSNLVFSESKQRFTRLVPAFALCNMGHVAGEPLGWLIETLQPILEQGNTSEVSQVLFNTTPKLNALDDYIWRVAPGQIINLCTFNNAHLVPVSPSLLSLTCPVLHSPTTQIRDFSRSIRVQE